MEPWVTLVIAGAAIAGYGWLKPEPKNETAATVNEEAYDKLLEDLETENRELVDAVAAFKREQDDTVSRLGRRIRELERQMEEGAFRGTEPPLRVPTARTEAIPPASASQEARMSGVNAAPRAAASAFQERRRQAIEEPVPASEIKPALDRPMQASEIKPAHDAYVAATSEEASEAAGKPVSIRERYAELVSLYERGRSVEQVAKAMNMNKGEVQLVLQLAKREVNRHE